MKKKYLAYLLSAAMLTSMMPTTSVYAAVTQGAEIQIQKKVSGSGFVDAQGSNTVEYSNDKKPTNVTFTVTNTEEATVQDVTVKVYKEGTSVAATNEGNGQLNAVAANSTADVEVNIDGLAVGKYTAKATIDNVESDTGVDFEVTAKEVTVTGVTADSREYDGTEAVTLKTDSASVVGVEEADKNDATLDGSAATGTVTTPDVENDKAVTVEGIALKGKKKDNYKVVQPTDVTVNITQATPNLGWNPDLTLGGQEGGSITAPEATDVTGVPVGATSAIRFKYYTDAQVQNPTTTANGASAEGGMPTKEGNYFVVATLEAMNNKNYKEASTPAQAFNITKGEETAPEAPQGLTGVAPTSAEGTDGKITGTTVAMEYAKQKNFSDKKDCAAGETTVGAAGTYYVRVKAADPKPAGAAATVVVPAYQAGTEIGKDNANGIIDGNSVPSDVDNVSVTAQVSGKTATATINTNALKALAEQSGTVGVQVKADAATVTLSKDVLKTIKEKDTGNKGAKIVIEKGEVSGVADLKQAVKVDVTVDNSSVDTFGTKGATVTLELPAEIASADKAYVYMLDRTSGTPKATGERLTATAHTVAVRAAGAKADVTMKKPGEIGVFTKEQQAPVVEISKVTITGVDAPVTGAKPVATATAGSAEYTVESVTWNPAVADKFEAGKAYTATITLVAAQGHKFPTTALTNDKVKVDSQNATSVTNGTNGKLVVTKEFAATKDVLKGNVTITGTPTFDQSLTADTKGITNASAAGTLKYQWTRDGQNIVSANTNTYTLTADDVKKMIAVKVTSDTLDGEVVSPAVGPVEKADCATTATVPTQDGSKQPTHNVITLTALPNHEFSKDGGQTWQKSNVFTGLEANKAYTFVSRVAETATHKASAASAASAKISTTDGSSLTPMAGDATITGDTTFGKTLTAEYTGADSGNAGTLYYKWFRGNVEIPNAAAKTYTLTAEDVGKTIKVQISCESLGGVKESAATAVVAKADAVGNATAPVFASATADTIRVTVVDGHEYSIENKNDWHTDGVISGLAAKTEYKIVSRIAETATHKASAPSSAVAMSTIEGSSKPSGGGSHSSSGGGSSSSTTTKSEITVSKDSHGKVELSKKDAKPGDTVIVKVTPDKGYEVDKVVVKDKDGKEIKVKKNAYGEYFFTMPKSGKVEVEPVFVREGEKKDEETKDETTKNDPIEMNTITSRTFNDVRANNWFKASVDYVVSEGIMAGVGDGNFAPNQNMTRAMVWQVLAKIDGVNTVGGAKWYSKAMDWAKMHKITDGSDVNGKVTREQLASMLYRYAKDRGMNVSVRGDVSRFADSKKVSGYASEAMQWAVGAGLINGMDGKLNPQGNATRAQVATILMNFDKLIK